jgi:DNA-binding transcriptional ArsR family regulator
LYLEGAMRVMDLTGRPQPLGVEIEDAVAYEFVTSLCVFFEEEDHGDLEIGRAWADDIRAKASPELLADLARFCAGSGMVWMALWGLVYESAAPKDVASFLAYLEALDPIEIRFRLLGEHSPAGRNPFPRDAIIRAAQGDEIALQEYLAYSASQCDPHDQECGLEARRYHAAQDPETDKRQLLQLLRGWYEQVFRHQEADLATILARDGAAKRALARTHQPDRLIELATNGLRYVGEPGINRVLLIPTVLFRPWVHIWEYRDAVLFCYAVAQESFQESATPAAARLVAIYKALSDERRLQALQRLATGSYTLQELADHLGIGKSLMHHHMRTLRAAGLVRVSIGGERRYEVRTETLADMPGLLNAYLGGSPGPAPICRRE